MPATVIGTAGASGMVSGAIVNYLMAMFPGQYQVTIAYGTVPKSTSTTVVNVTASADLQIDLTSAETIAQLQNPEVVGIVKLS